ncbi:C4-dicarboxylate ABC transporter substrate-binding protein [Salipiger sp. CCB-MM3]|uniref:TRAP transporter small permease n=1 Tax=Roseobacteraceae TaxID=2854170 RepID=UPI00080AACD6|nr:MULTISPECIES: TRAP transporter small permease subunit [Roseobacteraceae]ANT62617.1 C4-dicarboxylate ABC transporter substrate-binding protein [Salipiger sp. CCB-MM3]MCA0996794.1 TRAP transporter small permease [Alloyangia pacifica]
MDRLTRAARWVFAFGAGLSMALVFLIIFVNSIRRYAVGRSVPWGEELPIYLTIYGVMFGLALAYLSDSHIRFTVISDMLPKRVRHWVFTAADVMGIAAGIGLAYAGHVFALRRGGVDSSGLKATADALAQSTGIDALVWLGKVGPYQYAVAFGGAILAIAATLKLIQRLTGRTEV